MTLSPTAMIASVDAKLHNPGPAWMAFGFLFLWALFTWGIWFNNGLQTELIKNEMQREAELAVQTKAKEISGLMHRTVRTIRTIATLKSLNSSTAANRIHGSDGKVKSERISASEFGIAQHLYDELSSSIEISRIYVLTDGFKRGRGQVPVLVIGGTQDNDDPTNTSAHRGKSDLVDNSAEPKGMMEDFSEASVQLQRQLAHFRQHSPTMPREGTLYTTSTSAYLLGTNIAKHLGEINATERRNQLGISIAVPIYDPITRRFKGIVAAVVRSNALEAALTGLPFIPESVEQRRQLQNTSSIFRFNQPSNFLLENPAAGIQVYDRRNAYWATVAGSRDTPAYEYQSDVAIPGQAPWTLHNYVSKASVDKKIESVRSGSLVQFALLSFALALVWATLRSMMRQQLDATSRHLALAQELGQAADDHAKTRVKLQATLDTIADLFFEVSSDGRYHDVYARSADLLVMPIDRYLGSTVQETLPPEVATLWMDALTEASQHGVSTGIQYRLNLPQGDRWFELSVSRKLAQSSEETRFVVLAHDVTVRKQAEEALRKREAFFRLISENVGDHIVVVDLDGKCVYASPAYERFVGNAEGLKGSDAFALVHVDDQARTRAVFADIVRSGASVEIEYRHVSHSGQMIPLECHFAAIKNENNLIENVVLVSRDISERKAKDHEIENLAFYDALTELPNRRLLLDRLRQAMARQARTGSNGALMFLDLDNFKALNDTLGHAVGDILLQQVAARLLMCVRENDTVARLGGDEFVVMLEDLGPFPDDAASKAELIAEKVLAALNKPYRLGEYAHTSTPSIGVTLFGKPNENIDELLKRADLAMYQAKTAGRNAIRFFDSEMRARVLGQIALEANLRDGLGRGEFVLYYQAQINADDKIGGAETLLRWQHPQRGLIAPSEFIPLAEESGLILQLGQSVIDQACRQLATWATQPHLTSLSLAVNVSARQFHSANFVAQVIASVRESGANPGRLKLELTESLFVTNVEEVIVKMTTLKNIGVQFSLDDFGTGYSSLSYLKRLPLDQLKIDQTFVRDLLTDANDVAIARTIVGLADSLGLDVIAEGVETEGQRQCLAKQGCYAYQGFLFSEPLPLDRFEQLILAKGD